MEIKSQSLEVHGFLREVSTSTSFALDVLIGEKRGTKKWPLYFVQLNHVLQSVLIYSYVATFLVRLKFNTCVGIRWDCNYGIYCLKTRFLNRERKECVSYNLER